jgi:hypothetical protein
VQRRFGFAEVRHVVLCASLSVNLWPRLFTSSRERLTAVRESALRALCARETGVERQPDNQTTRDEGHFRDAQYFNQSRQRAVGWHGCAAHVDRHALGSLADQLELGLTALFVNCSPGRMPLQDRGKVLTQVALVLAGPESCADIEHLRVQTNLFGSVPSDTTVFRTFHEFTAPERDQLAEALAQVRARGRDTRPRRCPGQRLVNPASKSAPTYKGTFGFHPLLLLRRCDRRDALGEAARGQRHGQQCERPHRVPRRWLGPTAPRHHSGSPRR